MAIRRGIGFIHYDGIFLSKSEDILKYTYTPTATAVQCSA